MNRRFFWKEICWVGLMAFTPDVDAATFAAGDAESARKALATAKPGDEVVLAAGEWKDVDLRLVGHGTATAPIVVRSDKPGGTVFTGASRIRLGGEHVTLSGVWMKDISGSKADWLEFRIDSKLRAKHCRVIDCSFTESADFNPAEKESRWVGIYGQGNTLQRCFFSGKKNKGTTVVVWLGGEDTGHHHLIGNHFGERPRLGKNGGEALRVGDSKSSMMDAECLVEGNLFERCDGETECISNKSCGNVYRANTFREVQGTLTLRHGNRCTVEGNFFLGNHRSTTGGIRIIGEGHRVLNNYLEGLEGDGFRSPIVLVKGIPGSPANGYFQVKEATVAFNTIIDCKYGLLVGYNDVKEATLAPSHCQFVGNVVMARSPQSKILLIDAGSQEIDWRGNVFGGATAVAEIPGIVWRDPGLSQSGDGLWRPSKGSPGLDSVEGASSITRIDMDGDERGNPADAGADELATGSPKSRPLTSKDVGPGWR